MIDISISTLTLKPPLKWAGGKRWLLPHLRPLWEPYADRRLVEPFVGGLAVTLGLRPARALLSDINPHLMNFYQWLQRGLVPDFPMRYDRDCYYAYRDEFNRLIREGQRDSQRAAALFYYLNRSGYNGLCRFNRKDEFNVPFGRYSKVTYKEDFSDYTAALAGYQLARDDFEDLSLEPDDVIYADPPYDVEFVQYSQNGFSWDEQVRLGEWLAHHPGPVILSNQATERIVDLYTNLGFTLTYLQAPRRISCNGDRATAKEVLATRNSVGIEY